MTREEAIKILRREIECLSHTKCEDCILEAACDPIKTTPYDSEYIEVYEMAIKALEQDNCPYYVIDEDGHGLCKGNRSEQEPSGDLISRQAVFDLMRSLTRWCVRSENGKFNNVGLLYDDVMFGIDKLPSINPQEPKTGHWIVHPKGGIFTQLICDKCLLSAPYERRTNYCPNCGCRMVEPQESEDN